MNKNTKPVYNIFFLASTHSQSHWRTASSDLRITKNQHASSPKPILYSYFHHFQITNSVDNIFITHFIITKPRLYNSFHSSNIRKPVSNLSIIPFTITKAVFYIPFSLLHYYNAMVQTLSSTKINNHVIIYLNVICCIIHLSLNHVVVKVADSCSHILQCVSPIISQRVQTLVRRAYLGSSYDTTLNQPDDQTTEQNSGNVNIYRTRQGQDLLKKLPLGSMTLLLNYSRWPTSVVNSFNIFNIIFRYISLHRTFYIYLKYHKCKNIKSVL